MKAATHQQLEQGVAQEGATSGALEAPRADLARAQGALTIAEVQAVALEQHVDPLSGFALKMSVGAASILPLRHMEKT